MSTPRLMCGYPRVVVEHVEYHVKLLRPWERGGKGGSTGRRSATLSAGLPQPPAGVADSIALLVPHANQGRRTHIKAGWHS